jgi:hypothetical protein
MNEQDPFNRWRPNQNGLENVNDVVSSSILDFSSPKKEKAVTTNEMPEEKQESNSLSRYRPKQESNWDIAKRLGVQSIARPIEALGTLPGNFMRFFTDLGITGAEKLSGTTFPNLRKGLEQTAGYKLFPSSEQGREITSKFTGGLSEPQSELENAYGDVLELGTLLLTGAENPAAWQSLGKAVALATGSIGAKKGAKALGFGETGQAAAELGTLLLGGMYQPNGITTYLGNQYNNLYKSPTAKRVIPTQSMENGLTDLRSKWTKGGTTPAIRSALPKLDELESIAKKGNVEVSEILDAYKKINAEIQSRDLFEKLDKTGRKQLRSLYDDLKGVTSKALKSGTPNDFYKEWQDINHGYATFAKSRKIADWVGQHRDLIVKSVAPGVLGDLYLSIGATGPVAIGAGTAFAAKEIGEVLARISRSSKLRKYYLESLQHISKEQTPAAIKSIKKLEQAMKNEENR